MEIIGDIKTYDWGKMGCRSLVAKLAKLNFNEFEPKEQTPYAELWMCDHPSGPATIKSTGVHLNKAITSLQIGGQSSLPFLFKVLSIRKALSIQVHPNKNEAEKLNSTRPDIYRDANHKPELAIALTPFVALCGFRKYNEILEFLQRMEPLRELLGRNNVEGLKEGVLGLKACFSTLMKSRQDKVAACIKDISEDCNKVLQEYKLNAVFAAINRDFPEDVGVLCIFFLNVIHLNPGQSIFLPTNVPHAYLSGDCLECMACSDNVIRAGLTPKYKDVDTLLKMLNYDGVSVESQLFHSTKYDKFVQLYIPKVKDFAVAKFVIPQTEAIYKWKNIKYGSIILVLGGNRIMKTNLGDVNLKAGSVAFIPGNCGDIVELLQDTNYKKEVDFTAYMAMYNCFN